jgi:phosphoglycolate phosphatase-like HAD superfamily hydrolase
MPQPKTTLQALLFDVDGTLADTERDGHRPAFNQAFADAGLDWHWDAALYGKLLAVTGGKERMKYYIDRFRPDYRKPDNFDELVAGLHQAKTRHYSALAATGGIPMRPGVRRLLAEARAAGLRLAIATTTTPENVTVLLEHSLGPGTQDWFEVIAAGDIVPAKKPAGPRLHRRRRGAVRPRRPRRPQPAAGRPRPRPAVRRRGLPQNAARELNLPAKDARNAKEKQVFFARLRVLRG